MQIRRSKDCLMSTMGFPIMVRWHLCIESAPWFREGAKVIKTRSLEIRFTDKRLINSSVLS